MNWLMHRTSRMRPARAQRVQYVVFRSARREMGFKGHERNPLILGGYHRSQKHRTTSEIAQKSDLTHNLCKSGPAPCFFEKSALNQPSNSHRLEGASFPELQWAAECCSHTHHRHWGGGAMSPPKRHSPVEPPTQVVGLTPSTQCSSSWPSATVLGIGGPSLTGGGGGHSGHTGGAGRWWTTRMRRE